MRIGFTGTRRVPDYRVRDVLDWVDERVATLGGTEYTTGACVGFDALVAPHLLKTRPDDLHRLIVPANRAQVDTDMFHEFLTHSGGWKAIELMPAGTTYRDRNERILDHADVLLAVADAPENAGRSARSGTWMTVRIARKRFLPVHELVLMEI